MVTYKNIRVKKRGGGSRMQRVQVLASGKYKFVKNLKNKVTRKRSRSPTRRRTKTRKTNRKRGGNRMGRKGKSLAQTAYKLIPVMALAAPAIGTFMRSDISGKHKAGIVVRSYTGYSIPGMVATSGFNFGHMAEGWMPFIASKLVVKGVQKLNGLISRI